MRAMAGVICAVVVVVAPILVVVALLPARAVVEVALCRRPPQGRGVNNVRRGWRKRRGRGGRKGRRQRRELRCGSHGPKVRGGRLSHEVKAQRDGRRDDGDDSRARVRRNCKRRVRWQDWDQDLQRAHERMREGRRRVYAVHGEERENDHHQVRRDGHAEGGHFGARA